MKKIFFTLFLVLFSLPCFAENAYNIVKQQYDMNKGFSDEKGIGKMIIKSPSGEQTEREFEYQQLEENGTQGSKALIRIVKPANLAGTALLTYHNSNRDDDQWIYMPSFKKTNRIVGSAKRGNFIGSDFSFEDLAPKSIDDYTYTLVRDEPCGTTTCHVIDSLPAKKGLSYSKITVWQRVDNAQNQRMELYDEKGQLIKTTTFEDYRQLGGKYWRPYSITMQNMVNKSSSTLLVQSLNIANGLKDSNFTQSVLER